MIDLYHYVGSDLSKSPSGDLKPVTGLERGKQRVLRRLMTNPGDYIFHPDYGAGLGRKVGDIVNVKEWKALILGQMLLESCVAADPEPTVDVKVIEGGASVFIQYTDSGTGETAALSFDVTPD
ncbi:hypothetical protein [Paludibacterium yongneupense]|uniref:hypothetical protein n=1 Tax=Paludibacterium yongneupense TaxID=400061 RepID=UPI00048AF789|nr:hypothetical protein [Paludibacterium yongneupense]